jgi:hypothetical protein
VTTPADATAVKTAGTFSMQCAVQCSVRASADQIWRLLTDASRFPEWNSTVSRIEGAIALGQTLKLQVPSAPGRVFKPTVRGFEPGRSMVWSEGMAPMFKGVRTFTLTPGLDGTTVFAMSERLAGLMLPMIRGSLPDFGPIFEAYARDLRRAAEA